MDWGELKDACGEPVGPLYEATVEGENYRKGRIDEEVYRMAISPIGEDITAKDKLAAAKLWGQEHGYGRKQGADRIADSLEELLARIHAEERPEPTFIEAHETPALPERVPDGSPAQPVPLQPAEPTPAAPPEEREEERFKMGLASKATPEPHPDGVVVETGERVYSDAAVTAALEAGPRAPGRRVG